MGILGKTYHSMTDEQLMLDVAKKNNKAFDELYARYAGRTVNYFHRMLWQEEETAQDFTQEIFLKIVQKPHLYQEGRPFKTWFFSIANNMCKNEYRRREVRKPTSHDMPLQAMGETGNETIAAVDNIKFNEQLKLALDELDEKKRAVFLLRFEQDLSIKEISEAMECSEGTVKSRLFYTLKMLNGKLKAYEGIGALLLALHLLNELL
jgi:RNA polymerase sigma factor (sigma-70 family)